MIKKVEWVVKIVFFITMILAGLYFIVFTETQKEKFGDTILWVAIINFAVGMMLNFVPAIQMRRQQKKAERNNYGTSE